MKYVTDTITLNMIQQALELDRKYYPPQYWLTIDQCIGYFEKNNKIYTMLVDDDNVVVGYLNFSPISEKKFDEIASGTCLDTTIMPEDIERYESGGRYDAYLSSIVVDEKYRKKGAGNTFLKMLSAFIAALSDQGVYIKRIVADVLNEAGEKLAINFGLHKTIQTPNGSAIYRADLIPDTDMVFTGYNEELLQKYKGGVGQ